MIFTRLGDTLHPADEEAKLWLLKSSEGDQIGLEAKPRTPKQNSSLWKYCTQLAEALNAAGFDLRTFPFRDGLEIPFTKESVMSTFWRPIQDAMYDKESTRKLSTVEMQKVYEAVDRAISSRAGVHVEWPCLDSMESEARKLLRTKPKAKTASSAARPLQPWSSMNTLNRFCGPVCAAQWSAMKRDKDRVKAQRKERARARESLKTLGEWTKEAQVEFNKYIRERDYGKPCIACGTTNQYEGITGSSWDASHYRSRGSAPYLRFHLLNCAKCCTRCNRELSGNIVEMRKGMLTWLGEDRLAELEADNTRKQYRISDLKRIKSIFRRRANLYRKLREKSHELS